MTNVVKCARVCVSPEVHVSARVCVSSAQRVLYETCAIFSALLGAAFKQFAYPDLWFVFFHLKLVYKYFVFIWLVLQPPPPHPPTITARQKSPTT